MKRCCSIGGAAAEMRASGVAMRLAASLLFAALCFSAAAQSGRTNRVVCAEEAPICARADAKQNQTIVDRYDRSTRKQEVLWTVPSWLNIVRLDEQGNALLVESQSTLQLQRDISGSTALLALYRRGALAREFTVAEVFSLPGELELLKSAPAWAKRLPSPDPSVARYLLATGRIMSVNMTTGTLAGE